MYDLFVQTNLDLLNAGKMTQQQFKQIMRFANHKADTTFSQPIIAVRDELDIYPWCRQERIAEDALNQYKV